MPAKRCCAFKSPGPCWIWTQAGFHLLKQMEEIYPQRFYDVGAIVYQLKAVPWQIPDFTVQLYFERLGQIHQQIQLEGYVDVLEHRFFIIAEAPPDL
jgi:hypothetical protein